MIATGLRNRPALPAAASQFELPFDGLIAISDAAHDDHLRFHLREESSLRRSSEAFSLTMMRLRNRGGRKPRYSWVGRAKHKAAMFAAAVRIDAGFKPDIRAVIVIDDRRCGVAQQRVPGARS